MIRILYFASLREALGVASEEVNLPAEVGTVEALVLWLHLRGESWTGQLSPGKRWRVSVNHEMAGPGSAVKAGDEVAFFPPVTGG
jgi:molybdopterin synthase sulfur carrier subunit